MVGGEWCRCFEKADRPCLAMKRRGGAAPLLGAYRPSCDADGFFRATQCHAAVGTCWCVDKHGVEVDGSRARGKPDCGKPPPPPPLSQSFLLRYFRHHMKVDVIYAVKIISRLGKVK